MDVIQAVKEQIKGCMFIPTWAAVSGPEPYFFIYENESVSQCKNGFLIGIWKLKCFKGQVM